MCIQKNRYHQIKNLRYQNKITKTFIIQSITENSYHNAIACWVGMWDQRGVTRNFFFNSSGGKPQESKKSLYLGKKNI